MDDVDDIHQPIQPNPEASLPNCMDEDFISKYFGSSRLHHLSYWRTSLRAKIQSTLSRLPQPATSTHPPPWRTPPEFPLTKKVYLHCDLDSFFASVAIKHNSSLLGLPIAISHSRNGTGEIAACSYKAREYGVRASMWTSQAKVLCPDLVVVPYEPFSVYADLSLKMYKIFNKFVPSFKIKPISIDEAILDISDCSLHPFELATVIRAEIMAETGLSSSCGVGLGPRLSRIATSIAKPDGQLVIHGINFAQYLDELPISKVPGIGGILESQLKMIGVSVLGQLKTFDQENQSQLIEILGPKRTQIFTLLSRGTDTSDDLDLSSSLRSTVSTNINWGVRLTTLDNTLTFIDRVVKENITRLNEDDSNAGRMSLKLLIRAPSAPVIPPKWGGCGECVQYTEGINIDYDLKISRCQTSLLKDGRKCFERLYTKYGFDLTDIRGVAISFTKISKRGSNSGSNIEQFLLKSNKDKEIIPVSDEEDYDPIIQGKEFLNNISRIRGTLFKYEIISDVYYSMKTLLNSKISHAKFCLVVFYFKHLLSIQDYTSFDYLFQLLLRFKNTDWDEAVEVVRFLKQMK
ncbi:hypothetical protein P9112_013051 [Eukaryota sp. TZLM1-RC]